MTKPGVILICAADIKPQPIRWLWPNRFALGKISMIAGQPGLGKSQLALHMAAQITTGGKWPNGEGDAPAGRAVFLSCEDDPADTLVPRLIAAGADVSRVHFVKAVKDPPALGSRERQFNITKDIGRLCEAIDEIGGDVKLVVVDPITAYLGSGRDVDSHKATDVRDALTPLQYHTEKFDFASILISHLNKGGSTEALNRVMGSQAFVGLARTVYLVVGDTESERTLFLQTKTNISKKRPGLAYRPVTKFIPSDEHGAIETTSIEWDEGEVHKSADEALAAAAGRESDKGGEQTSIGEAMNFLRDVLSEGPASAKAIQHQAKEAGISRATLRRAQKAMGVKARHRGDGGTGGRGEWVWEMPEQIILRDALTHK